MTLRGYVNKFERAIEAVEDAQAIRHKYKLAPDGGLKEAKQLLSEWKAIAEKGMAFWNSIQFPAKPKEPSGS
jgi:hypothetical protein